MGLPDLLIYEHESDYQAHFVQKYCRTQIYTFDRIRVFFHPGSFQHSFFESTQRNGVKDLFSRTRAERMDWIKATLENPSAELYQGWDSKKRRYLNNRRVSVVYEEFVVVIDISLNQSGQCKANFVTCYQADNSIGKIKRSPKWTP